MDGWMDGWLNGWMSGWMSESEWMDEWMDGWVDGWMSERMDEWMGMKNESILLFRLMSWWIDITMNGEKFEFWEFTKTETASRVR